VTPRNASQRQTKVISARESSTFNDKKRLHLTIQEKSKCNYESHFASEVTRFSGNVAEADLNRYGTTHKRSEGFGHNFSIQRNLGGHQFKPKIRSANRIKVAQLKVALIDLKIGSIEHGLSQQLKSKRRRIHSRKKNECSEKF